MHARIIWYPGPGEIDFTALFHAYFPEPFAVECVAVYLFQRSWKCYFFYSAVHEAALSDCPQPAPWRECHALQILAAIKRLFPDNRDTRWNRHAFDLCALEPLFSNLLDAFRNCQVFQPPEVEKESVAYQLFYRQHHHSVSGVLLS